MMEGDEKQTLVAPTRLAPFTPDKAGVVLTWALAPADCHFWCARDKAPDAGEFIRWHSDAGVLPFILETEDVPLAYGELWHDETDHSVELARLLVDPQHRRKGAGERLVELLCTEANRLDAETVLVRVFPENGAARRCYAQAGFEEFTEEQQACLNQGERFRFVWMSRAV